MKRNAAFTPPIPRSMRPVYTIVLTLSTLGYGCHTAPPEGVYPCTMPGTHVGAPECPEQWYCREDERCWSTPDRDAATEDAGLADATGPDSPVLDASRCTPTAPATETCDGLDNDCDGVIDGPSATMSCESGSTCVQAHCVPRVRWSHSFVNGRGASLWSAIAIDSHDAAIAVGEVDSTDLGAGTIGRAAGIDWLVASFDTSGGLRWGRAIGGTENDWAYGVTTTNDAVAVAGSFRGTVNFGTGHSLVAATTIDNAIVGLDPTTGATLWTLQIGAEGTVAMGAVDDMVIALVSLTGTTTLGGRTVGVAGTSSCVLVAIDAASGDVSWTRTIQGARAGQSPGAVAGIGSGRIAVGLNLATGSVDFGAGPVDGGPIGIGVFSSIDGHVINAARLGTSADTTVVSAVGDTSQFCVSGRQTHPDFGGAGGSASYVTCLSTSGLTTSLSASWAQLSLSIAGMDAAFVYLAGTNVGTTSVVFAGTSIPATGGAVAAMSLASDFSWARAFDGMTGATVRSETLAVVGNTGSPVDWGTGDMPPGLDLGVYDL